MGGEDKTMPCLVVLSIHSLWQKKMKMAGGRVSRRLVERSLSGYWLRLSAAFGRVL